MRYRTGILWLLLWWLLSPLQAQQDSLWTIALPDSITIVQNRLPQYGMGQRYEHLDSARLAIYQGQNLAQVLALESSIFVKNYGPSGISTLSGRGGGASHTAVLWEGFDIQNPMLGQSDVALLPMAFVDYVDVQYGGGSSLFGNSGLGGAIHLGTAPAYGRGFWASGQGSYGSFETLKQSLQLHYSNAQYATSLRILHHQAQNNFWYTDRNAFGFPKPIRQQDHARTHQTGILHEQALRLQQHQWRFKTWYQYHERQIPPTLLAQQSTDEQTDQSWRSTLQWRHMGEQGTWHARTGLFWESLWFRNDATNSLSQTWSSITAVERHWYWGQQRLQLGGQYAYYNAQSTGYAQSPFEHRQALFAAYQWEDAKGKAWLAASVRQARVNAQWMRPAASIGGRWQAHPHLVLNTQASHNYRLPTFNDRFWPVLGQPDLLPEYSWNTELGLTLPIETARLYLEGGAHAFSNWVDDWILWSPNDAGLWRPANIDQVWARGIEGRFLGRYPFPKGQLTLRANYAFTQSIRTQGQEPQTLGKQLVYTPVHQANAALEGRYRQHRLLYQHQWSSRRYIDNANTQWLPFFHVGNVRYSYGWKGPRSTWTAYLQVYNVFGADYQVVNARPMPWQQIEVGLQWSVR